MKRTQLFWISAVLSGVLPLMCSAQGNIREVRLAPASETLVGVLKIDTVLGPPGYGEDPKTDRKVRIYSLHLRTPIGASVHGEQTGAVDRVELFFPHLRGEDSWEAAHRMIGSCVSVKGRLRVSELGAEFTPLVMDVSTLLRKSSKTSACAVADK